MATRIRTFVRRWIPVLCLLAGASPGWAGDPVPTPLFCENFEQGYACDWWIGPSCLTSTVCGGPNECVGEVCECTPSLAQVAFLEGHWTGTWEDTIYNVSGAVEATFSIVGAELQASGLIDLTEISGALGEQAGTGVGVLCGETLYFTFEAEMVGSGTGTLTAAGVGDGSGSVTAPLSFGAFTFTGTTTTTTITGTFDFTSKTGGEGNVTLTKD